MRRRASIRVVVGLLVLGSGLTLAYRKAYGTWWQRPEKLAWCDRTYVHYRQDAPLFSRAQIDRSAPSPVVRVGTVPPLVGRPLIASVTPDSDRASGGPCSMAVFLETGEDTYAAYSLSGGP